MNRIKKTRAEFSISRAFRESFYGFRKLWAIFCSLAVVILFFESYLPKIIIRSVSCAKYVKPYLFALRRFKSELLSINRASEAFIDLKRSLIEITSVALSAPDFYLLASKIASIFLALILLLCLLYVLTILFSKYSVWANKEDAHLKKSLKRSPLISLSYLVLSFIKAAPFSISLAIPVLYLAIRVAKANVMDFDEFDYFNNFWLNLVYILEFAGVVFASIAGLVVSTIIYVRLYFTGFVITEESVNPFAAMKKSWEITQGRVPKLFALFLITIVGDVVAGLTIVCFIPWSGIKSALRASVYQQIKIA